MITLKFGGTSVQDLPAVERLIQIVTTRGGKRLVVTSALAKVTDQLLQAVEYVRVGQFLNAENLLLKIRDRHLELIQELGLERKSRDHIVQQFFEVDQILRSLDTIGEVSLRSVDRIVCLGELSSSYILAQALRSSGLRTQWFDSRTVLKTDGQFGNAQVDFSLSERLVSELMMPRFKEVDVLVVGGFIASTDIKGQSVTTTLGRGGSDYSAAVLGSALDSERIEIWTDVNGILTTDPRMVAEAKRITRLSFDEAAELAYFGAKVLHPATIYPAVKKQIPVWVLNSLNANSSGTVITQESTSDQNVIKALACKRNVTLVNIYSTRMLGASGFLQSVFSTFAKHRVSIDLISTSEVNVSLTLDPKTDPENLQLVIAELEKFSLVSVQTQLASIAAVGKGIRLAAGVGARIFGALKGHNISMISMGSSEVNISLVVQDADTKAVIQKLHDEFFKGDLNPDLFAENE